MKNPFLLFSLSLLVLACGSNKSKDITNTTETSVTENSVDNYANTITSDELKTDLYIYASDEFEGRETGEPGQKKAVNFLKDRYVSLGIPSALNGDDYFQEVPLEVLGTPTATIEVGENNFNYRDNFVALTGNTGTFNTNEIVYAGYGIEEENYSDYTNIDVKNKVVLIKNGEPQKEDGSYLLSGTTESSGWSNFRQEYAKKRDVAIAKGAKALLFYYPSVYSYMQRRYGESSHRMSLQGNNDAMYYFFIDESLAKGLVSDIDTNNRVHTISKDFSLNYTKNTTEFNSENVAALIKGSEHPDEVIVISAHLDHEGIKDGEIYNGADDDGSGTVAILEIAEAFQEAVQKGNGPKRSILFLHVTGEERGLLGSRYYTDFDPIIKLDNTVANLNIDMIGRIDPKHEDNPTQNYLYLIGSDKLSTELHNLSEEVNKECCNIEFDYKYNDDNDPNRFYYRSDHYNFAKNNIPVIFYFNGTHADYHKPSDTPDKINYEFLQDRTRLIFQTAWKIANLDHRLVVDKEFE